MKDQIIPHILRDRIIMYIKTHNSEVPPHQKADYIDEIVTTYFKLLNMGKTELDIYALYFSLITNYETFRWIRKRMDNKDEDKPKIFDFIKNYAFSTNFEVKWKKDMSNIMEWRYNQYPHIQDDLNRLVFMLSGKEFTEIKEEIRQLNS